MKNLVAALSLSAAFLATPALAFEDGRIVVGASYVPHAEILEEAQPILAEQGIELVIQPFQDYILPNTALAGGDIDANYFQHQPYLDEVLANFADDPTYDFVNVGGVHVEPIGIYSQRYESLADLPENGRVIMRDAVSEEGRILSIFEREGVIKLREGVEKAAARISDIVENPKNLQFQANIEGALLPQIYANDEGDAVVINANYALDAGLDPANDPIAIESAEDNPYTNIIVVRQENAERPEVRALVEVLQSEPIREFIEERYNGAVIPASQ